MVHTERLDDVHVLHLGDGENKWTTTFTRELDAALDEIEGSDGPGAMVMVSDHEKFFSNGLDLDWIFGGRDGDDGIDRDAPENGGDRKVFGHEAMSLFGRIITFPMPTVCAVNGHAFGAGFMVSLAHDVRIAREDRGYMCANEIEIGVPIPQAELSLFKHKMSASAFHQTTVLAKRWSGPAAVEAGFVDQAVPGDMVREAALDTAAGLAHLGKNRELMRSMKESIYGENAALNHPHGPAYMLQHSADF